MFPLLTKFVFSPLSLRHSSATVEQTFSAINDMKSEIRSKLGDELLSGLYIYTKQSLHNSNCFDINITKSMRSFLIFTKILKMNSNMVKFLRLM